MSLSTWIPESIVIMQLMRFTDYALRVMLFVCRQRNRVCTMREIAAYYRISREHLRKVIHKLAKLGYLNTSRGRGGGITLKPDPAKIRIGDVILAMEEDLSIVDCHALGCVLQPGCSLKTALNRGSRAFIATLNEVTLADLLGNTEMKRQFRVVDAGKHA
ncbi:MAG TPA: Rrf2 family transcriptional regulator [Rudaea sp.]|uniref:RrF2 family transcriptional regulator n=1 Tax=Rudaea sp. TaxID=2136325 RepID=UPI002F931A59